MEIQEHKTKTDNGAEIDGMPPAMQFIKQIHSSNEFFQYMEKLIAKQGEQKSNVQN